jgi:hypothetical protein
MTETSETKSEAKPQTAVASSDWLGVGVRHPDGEVTCRMCGYETEWEPCYAGCDYGYFDGYEEDQLWYDHLWCTNNECKNGEITRIVKAKTPNGGDEPRPE